MNLPADFFPADKEITAEVKTAIENPAIVELIVGYNAGLVRKRDEVLGKLSTKEQVLKDLGDIEAVKTKLSHYDQYMAEKAELEAKANKTNQSVEEVRTQMQALLEERDSRIAAIEQKRVATERQARLTRAIKEAGGDPDLLMPFIDKRIQHRVDANDDLVFEVRTEDGKPLLKDNGDPAGLKELVGEFKGNAKYAVMFEADNLGGTGARNGTAGNAGIDNPFLKSSPNYNVAAQSKLYRDNKALCIQLAAQAGVTIT
jgi:hypothetical protein